MSWSPHKVFSLSLTSSGRHRDLPCDIPHERGHLTCDGDRDLVGVQAACFQSTIAFAEAQLGLPGDVLCEAGRPFDTLLDVRGDLGRVLVSPGCFHQHAPGMGVAGFGDTAESPAWTAGIDRGDEAAGTIGAR